MQSAIAGLVGGCVLGLLSERWASSVARSLSLSLSCVLPYALGAIGSGQGSSVRELVVAGTLGASMWYMASRIRVIGLTGGIASGKASHGK